MEGRLLDKNVLRNLVPIFQALLENLDLKYSEFWNVIQLSFEATVLTEPSAAWPFRGLCDSLKDMPPLVIFIFKFLLLYVA